MSPRKPRGLSAEEKSLWSKVIESAQPQGAPQTLFSKQKIATSTPKKTPKAEPLPPLIPFRVGENARPSQAASAQLPPAPQMDRKQFLKMKRGKIAPDVKIDLHGMTQAQAQPALVSTILNAHAAGKRLVLVVTGKGKLRDDGGPIPVRTGILRHAVPHWLKQAPLASVVLEVTEASQGHGGSGAFYVYLRRIR